MSVGYIVRRLLQMLPVAAGILVLTFLIVHVFGDPTELDAEGADPAQVDLVRAELGLDRPLPEQFEGYIRRLLHGDLGRSFQGPPVASLIRERLAPTLLLMGTALALSTAVGISAGLLATRQPFSFLDRAISGAALVGYAIPSFWLAQLVVLAVVLPTGLFPVEGMTEARTQKVGLAHVADVARHLALPALVLATSEVALLARVTRTGLMQQLDTDYVRSARAKGAPSDRVMSRHALPNALLPVITVIGSRLGFLLSGAVLVESVFAWPGLGTLLVSSALGRDQPVVLAMVLMASFGVMVATLLTDLVCGWIDPRIQYS